MKLNDLKRQIVLVSGRLCSGKGHYCAQHYPGYRVIGVSSIVKALVNSEKRSDTAGTNHLDQQIIKHLIAEISKYDKVVVEGIRQPTILEALQNHFGSQIVDVIWLDVPEDVRKERFQNRGRPGDDQSFDEAGRGDEGLGIGDVERIMRATGRVAQN